MTTKILTIRLPSAMYSKLCTEAGEIGIPVSAHVRRYIERERDHDAIADLQKGMQELIRHTAPQSATSSSSTAEVLEILWLCRAIATDRNPQIVAQVRAKLQQLVHHNKDKS